MRPGELPSVKVTAYPEAPMWTKRSTQVSSTQERKLIQSSMIDVMISNTLSLEAETKAQG